MQRRHLLRSLGTAALGAAVLPSFRPTAAAQQWGVVSSPPPVVAPPRPDPAFSSVIQRVVRMPMDQALQARVQRHGLHAVNVMWEDTGRYQGSSVGPNISDLTLQVREPMGRGRVRTHLLPVIRYPNFSDRTADVRADKIFVRVGNHLDGYETADQGLHAVPLTEVLRNLKAYLSDPSSVLGDGDLSARRDSHYLVSAQHVFVPLMAAGTAEFNPVLYNYQSYEGQPAVLTLLVTRQGTSATVIENRSGDQSYQGWGQQLFFNHEGQRTVFTAERRSAVARRIEQGNTTAQDRGALEEGADMMMIVQVPLRQRRRPTRGAPVGLDALGEGAAYGAAPAEAQAQSRGSGRSDVEAAVIGHGDALGPFREGGDLRLIRDDRFPVRVTVQFYKATSNGIVSDADVDDAHRAIERVYADGDFVGSLVVPKSESDRLRPTQWRRRGRCWRRRSGSARLRCG